MRHNTALRLVVRHPKPPQEAPQEAPQAPDKKVVYGHFHKPPAPYQLCAPMELVVDFKPFAERLHEHEQHGMDAIACTVSAPKGQETL